MMAPKADRSTDLLNVSLGPVLMGLLLLCIGLAGCGEDPVDDPDNTENQATSHTVTPLAGTGGSISPDTAQTVEHGESTSFSVTPDEGYRIDVIGGCGGALDGDTYTTGPITADCTVIAGFIIEEETQADSYTVTPMAGNGGSISPGTAQTVEHGETTSFTITPDEGYRVDAVGGCDGALEGDIYTTGPITADCTVTASFVEIPAPSAAVLSAEGAPTSVTLSWSGDAATYNLFYFTSPDCDTANYNLCDGGTLITDVTSPHTITGLNTNQNYWFRLESANSSGTALSKSGTAGAVVEREG